MNIVNYKDLEIMKNPHSVEAKKLLDTEHAQVIHMHLKAGEKLKPHTTPVDVFFYVLEGEGYVEIGEEKVLVKKDTLIESPKGIIHCLYNESKEDFRVLVVKTPKPSQATEIR
ncbi:MAG: cupin domain-containing protein [Bacteroidales bacterium]|jgi:mannose-6-phosphate isomerase-like protein (cupin superfamily)|nr:cupin domain-containing protein [Bacteroidales bacterium]MDD4001287.1 cupin domain-containing protein [Bacteroidales bacterium]MDD4528885.1 cupin domain-containing protein [Bacteroidales bacterium]MDD4829921.1 cupin domain-containing protein [Bacteroidales bacterium]